MAFLTDLIHFSGANTIELIKKFLASHIIPQDDKIEDIFIPNNEKTVLENLIRKNIYRSDPFLVTKLVRFAQVLL